LSQWLSVALIIAVLAVSVGALVGKVDILTFWLVIGLAFLYVKFFLPRLREREAGHPQKP
jgi:hypothetical protein